MSFTILDIQQSLYDREVGYFFASLGQGEMSVDTDAEYWFPPNMVSIPSPQIENEYSQALSVGDTQNKKIIATRDSTMKQWIGLIDQGETVLGAPGPQREGLNRLFLKNDNISLICQQENDPTKPTAIQTLDINNGALTAINKSAFAMDWDGKITLSNSEAALMIIEKVMTILAENIKLGGQTVMLGASATTALSCAIAEPIIAELNAIKATLGSLTGQAAFSVPYTGAGISAIASSSVKVGI